MSKKQKKQTTQVEVERFSHDDWVSRIELLDAMECTDNGRYFELPVNARDLIRLLGTGVHHNSALQAKLNILTSTFIPTPLLSRTEFKKLAFNYLVLGNAYLEAQRNLHGKVLRFQNRLALYMRRASNLTDYVYLRQPSHPLQNQNDAEETISGYNIAHLMQPDLRQEVYGVPHYLAALNSIELNASATKFRRRYYDNGSHAGFIFYATDAQINEDDWETLKQNMREAKGGGNFKNMYLRSVNGSKDGIQLIPISEVAAKDEFLNIKSVSADDMLAIHRVPPKLMGIVPKSAGSLGDAITDAKVFAVNEVQPIQRDMLALNDMFGLPVLEFEPYQIERGDA